MNDDIFRPGGGDPVESSRVLGESSTINEAGTEGFAVDGTDGFAIDERPVEGPVVPSAEELDDVAAVGRGRLAAIVGAALAGLLIVIAVGSNTGPRPVVGEAGLLRTEDVDDVTTTTEDEDELSRAGAWSRPLMVVWDSSPGRGPEADFDDEALAATTETTFDEFEFDREFDDEFVSEFDDDFFDEDRSGRTVLPRRIPVVTSPGRPRVTVPTRTTPTNDDDDEDDEDDDTTTTVASTTTATTAAETTTTATTTPTTTAPTTVAPVPAAWVPAGAGLPCVDGLQLWARPRGLVAGVAGGGLFTSPDGVGTWTRVVGAAGTAKVSAFVQHPDDLDTFWIGGSDGVLQVVNGTTLPELGDLADVRSLSVDTSGGSPTILAVADNPATLQRWVGTRWEPVPPPIGDIGELVQVQALGAQRFLVATTTRILLTENGGAEWRSPPEFTGSVAGVPLRTGTGQQVSWLLANGAVIRSADGRSPWEPWVSTGSVVPSTASLVHGPGTELRAANAKNLLKSAGGGATWTPTGPELPYEPAGVTYSPVAKATFVWPATCGQSVMRLADG